MRFVAKWQKNKDRFDKFLKLQNHLEERLNQESICIFSQKLEYPQYFHEAG